MWGPKRPGVLWDSAVLPHGHNQLEADVVCGRSVSLGFLFLVSQALSTEHGGLDGGRI